MKNFFTKTLEEIDEKDILDLIGTPEGQLFEAKENLSAEKKHTDPWLKDPEPGKPRKGPGDYAKQNIFKELVAFANSEGGWLVLGLRETNARPKRVKCIKPIPDCHELSSRFERAAQDWTDPPLPSLSCIGLQIGDLQNEGVVIFRVARSYDAPHRLYKSGRSQEAYKRVGDESKPMKMREIKDLAFEIYRDHERIDTEFNMLQKRYLQIKPERSPKIEMAGFRISLVPLVPLTIDRPYLHESLFNRNPEISGSFSNGKSLPLTTMDDDNLNRTVGGILPILRGASRRWASKSDDEEGPPNEDITVIEVTANGTINMVVKSTFTNPVGLYIRWILADLANALIVSREARLIGSSPNTEYALELELRYDHYQKLSGLITTPHIFPFILLPDKDEQYLIKQLGPEPLLLPRYRVGSQNEFPVLLKRVMDDLYNAVGEQSIDDFHINPIA